MKEYAGAALVVQTDGSAEKKVATTGFVILSPLRYELVYIGRIAAGSTNNDAEFVAIC